MLLDQIKVELGRVAPLIMAAGLEVPDCSNWLQLSYHRRSAEGRYQLACSVLEIHDDLIVTLEAVDHQLGLAYAVGRALADLSLRPSLKVAKSLSDDLLSERVRAISAWSHELRSVLPAHAAGAVIGSVTQWQEWAQHPTWHGELLDWTEHGQEVVCTLEAQGERWRLLLTGQVAPLDQLSADDYVQAAGYLVGRVQRILRRTVAQYRLPMVVLTVAMVVAVVLSATLLHTGTDKGIGVAVTLFGYIGITGKSISAALRKAVDSAESSLWGAELDLAAAWASTKLPATDVDRKLREPSIPKLPVRSFTRRLARIQKTPKKDPGNRR